ncbi:MAG: ABC transporter permease [Clostridia bacterium]|nr:ABC transporter permease [Clostridia bacterium]
MGKYVIKRILLAVLTAFIVLSLTFILVKLLPPEKSVGNAVTRQAYYDNQVSLGYMISSRFEIAGLELVDFVTAKNGTRTYYYEVPVMEQYFNWISNILFHWEWGYSQILEPNVSATVIIGERLVTSMKINIVSVLVSVPIGILLGIWAALKKNTLTDHIISTSVMILISLPSFVIITFLMLLLCYNSHVLPTQWPNPTDPIGEKILGYILPVFCLSLGSICGYCRFVRAELCDVMASDYLLLARTKGLTRKQAIFRHALKNAMVPIFPSILAEFIGILGGSMILENLYGIPGIGSLFVKSLTAKDYNILFVDLAIFTTLGLLAGVVLDLSYGFIDPRIRMGAKK